MRLTLQAGRVSQRYAAVCSGNWECVPEPEVFWQLLTRTVSVLAIHW